MIPEFAQSSVNPEEVSLTVQSLGKMAAGLVTFVAVLKGVDPILAQAAWGNFIAQITTAIPAGFVVWHAGNAVYGIGRKAAVRLFTKVPVKSSITVNTVTG